MADDTACFHVEGTGCGSEGNPDVCEGEDTQPDSGTDSGIYETVGRPCGPAGTCEGCASLPGAPGMWAVIVLFALARRRRRPPVALLLVLIALLGVAGRASAQGIDAQHLQPLDGGTFPALREATAGGAWEPSAAVSVSWANGLVNQVDALGRLPLLQEVVTAEFGGSLRIGELVRVGVALPVHPYVLWKREVVGSRGPLDDASNVPLGDVAVWAQVPMFDGKKGIGVSWYVHADIPSGSPEYYLGDPQGGVTGLVAASRRVGDWELLANLGVRLATVTQIPGIAWGVRGEYGVGVHWRIVSRLDVNAELFGSLSLPPDPSPGDAPLELLGTVGWDFGSGFALHAGGGTGLTTGVGSPEARVLVMADLRRRAYEDRDGDGIIDVRDRCVDVPEDLDGFADEDGCPEDDLDDDGVDDQADACPKLAETINGYLDRDGCPDTVTEVVLTVAEDYPAAEGPLEQAELTLAEIEPFVAFAGEPVSVVLPPGRYEVKAQADGFHPYSSWIAVPNQGPYPYTVTMNAIRFGDVTLRVTDPADVPLDGYLRRPPEAGGGPMELLPKEGRTLSLPAGPTSFLVQAPGYLPREVSVEVPLERRIDVIVELQPSDLRIVGSRVETTQTVRFALDSAAIPPGGEGPLDDLAALLLADRRIELLRIEGHADERGTSRYNLDLSHRRAIAIRDWLIAAGVEAGRLEAIGTGEARPAREGETASRRVEFTVLVWADEAGAAPVVPAVLPAGASEGAGVPVGPE